MGSPSGPLRNDGIAKEQYRREVRGGQF
jgi:hypothetical protein